MSEKHTLEKIGSVMADIADIFGLGSRVVSDVSSLLTSESKTQFIAESSTRADEIKSSRKNSSKK
jgi:hypothetical protein